MGVDVEPYVRHNGRRLRHNHPNSHPHVRLEENHDGICQVDGLHCGHLLLSSSCHFPYRILPRGDWWSSLPAA